VVVAFVAVLLLWGLSRFGIWDPWELGTADAARKLAAGEAQHGPFSLGTWLVSCGFRAFGVHEWAGRAPIALTGIVCVVCALELGRTFADARTGVYAALIAATTPLFLVNSRLMVGAAPYMAVQSLLGLATLRALLPSGAERAGRTMAWCALALLFTAAAIFTRGALLGALPPLLACVAVAWTGELRARARAAQLSLVVLGAVALVAALCVARDVMRDAVDYSVWLGGSSHAFAPPTFDRVVEHVFHAFAPWSALLPIAFSRTWLLDPTPDDPAEAQLRGLSAACMLWIAIGYGAQTLFLSRYGRDITYLPVVPLAILVSLLLRDLERRSESAWGAALAAILLVGLVIRDFALYPAGPVAGLPISAFELPKIWNPAGALAAVLLPFAACAALGFSAGEREQRLDLRAPYRLVRAQWQRGLGFRLWLIAGALLFVGMLVFGGLAYAIPRRLHMPSLAIRFIRKLLFAPFVIAAAVAAGQTLTFAFSRLTTRRFVPLLVAGAACGVYFAQVFLPQLSEHFSPREVYSAYNELAGTGEPLAEYRVGGRAAAYYAKGEVVEVSNVTQLVDHLAKEGQRWAAFPSSELAEIDRNFRNRTGRHLVVVDAKSARVVLAASQPVAKRADSNELSRAVLKAAPAHLQHPVAVNFDDRVELLGYDTVLPHQTYVGAGESFTLTWYFRTLRKIPSGYRLFVHIDGDGQRIHGDHDPVQNKYPVQLWEVGDVIADEQKIDVPASTRAGEYTIFMGFYSGDNRLPIRSGPNAGEDRARVGVLRIQ
jgi:4-amino-4-deoxy-L-arabinose transferase-like glycosyltransferase